MKTTQQQQSNYDQLLEVYLPIIHRAANSIHSERCQQSTLEDLLMAGFQGFKEAFNQLPTTDFSDTQNTFSTIIYQSMAKQIKGHYSEYQN